MLARRGKGEGSIFQRSDGRWCAQVSDGYGPSGRKRSYVYGKTRVEVARKLTEALAAKQNGVRKTITDKRVTVAQWLDRWVELDSERRGSTLDRYRSAIKVHLAPALGRIRLAELSVHDVDDYKRLKREQGYSPASIQVHLFCLSAALGAAHARGMISSGVNVVRLSGWVRVPRYKSEFLDPERARVFLDNVRQDRQGPLLTFILCVGLRISEAIAVKWTDIDMEHRFVTISRQVSLVEHEGATITDVKTPSGRRAIKLPDLAIEALDRQRFIQAGQRAKARGRWRDLDFVFTSGVGTPIDAHRVRREFHLLEPGVRRVHDLRHSFGSLLLKQGVPLKVISEMLGHSSIAVTASIYAHVMPEAQQDAAHQLDDLLGQTVRLAVKA